VGAPAAIPAVVALSKQPKSTIFRLSPGVAVFYVLGLLSGALYLDLALEAGPFSNSLVMAFIAVGWVVTGEIMRRLGL